MIFNVGSGGASSADKVKYDNRTSGLKATNVQGAVDEVNNSIGELSNSLKSISTWTKIIDATQTSDSDKEYSFSSLGVDVSKINEILIVIKFAFLANQANYHSNAFFIKEQLINALQNSESLTCVTPYNTSGTGQITISGKGNLDTFNLYFFTTIQNRGYEIWVR